MADIEEEAGTGIGGRATSRRSFLVKSAVVASAAVWVPPVVESFTSPAAAQSVVFPCSWAYVFWYDKTAGAGSQLYVTGFQKTSGSACGSFAANPHSATTLSCDGYKVAFTTFSGTPPNFAYTYGTTTGQTMQVDAPVCADYVTDSGATISGTNAVVLIGAVYFGAGSIGTLCASNNTVTLPTKC